MRMVRKKRCAQYSFISSLAPRWKEALMIKFNDRSHAGQLLAKQLNHYQNQPDTLILALPRGGVPVAFEIAKALHLPLDVYLVRKLGVPGHPELAMGAIANGDVTVFNSEIINALTITREELQAVIAAERQELRRRQQRYRHINSPLSIINKTIILVDDGLATGATMRAAIVALKKANPKKIIIAVPVSAPEICEQFKSITDEMICLLTPEPLYGVGMWYHSFPQTSDEEVIQLLAQAMAFSQVTKNGAKI